MKRALKIYLEKPELAGVLLLIVLDGVLRGPVERRVPVVSEHPGRARTAARGRGGDDRLRDPDDLRRIRSLGRLCFRDNADEHRPHAQRRSSVLAGVSRRRARICAVIGFVNGFITLRFDIPSFITTLGMLFMVRSLTVVISGGFPPLLAVDKIPMELFTGFIGGGLFRASFIWFVILALLASAVMAMTNFGNWIKATGGFLEAARSMGIPVARVKFACFMICSILAGLAGTVQVFRLQSPFPNLGESLELQAIAGSVIGGVALTGRRRHRLRRDRRRAPDPRHRQRPRSFPHRRQLVQIRDRGAHRVRGCRQFVAATHGAPDQVGGVSVAPPIISIKGLHKWYSGVHALDGIDLDIQPGELIGLVGDNGAGKSTLIKVLSGVEPPDSGEIRVEGRARRDQVAEVGDAARNRDRLPVQLDGSDHDGRPQSLHRTRAAMFSVGGIGVMNQRKMREDSIRAIADVDLHLRSPDTLVGELSGGQRQGVAIARAMYFKSKVLILDEPTNHLSVKETAKVLGFVKGLPAQNVTGHSDQPQPAPRLRLVRTRRGDGERQDRARQEDL